MQQPAELSAKISGRRADRISHVMFKLASHAALNAHRVGRSKWPQQPVPSSSFPRAHRWAWSLGLPSHVDRTISAPIHEIHLPVECTGRANSPSDGRPRATTSALIGCEVLRSKQPPIACAVGRDHYPRRPYTPPANTRGQCLDRRELLYGGGTPDQLRRDA